MPQPLRFFGLALLAVVAGASFVVQGAVNARLKAALGSATWAALASYVGGSITMLLVVLAAREPWLTLAGVRQAPWWAWTGGAFGAVYVVVIIALLPRLGSATVLALFVLGQMTASVAIDHLGLFGLTRYPVDVARVAGVALLVGGVVLIRR